MAKSEQNNNNINGNQCSEGQEPVRHFGFDITTCCGVIPKDNTWQDNWEVHVVFKSG